MFPGDKNDFNIFQSVIKEWRQLRGCETGYYTIDWRLQNIALFDLHSTLVISTRKLRLRWTMIFRNEGKSQNARKVKLMIHSEENSLSSRSSERNKINIEVDYWTDKAKIGKCSVEKSTKTYFFLAWGDKMPGISNDCIERYSIHQWPDFLLQEANN